MLTTLLLAAAAAPQIVDAPSVALPESLVRVDLSDQGRLEQLLGLGLDIPHVHHGAEQAQLIADAGDLSTLQRLGIPYEIMVDDLEAWYAARLAGNTQNQQSGSGYGSSLNPPFSQGGMGGYWTYAEVTSVLDQIVANHPALVAPKQSIGTTIEGRQIWMVKVSDNPGIDEAESEVRLDSLHHAREPEGMQASLWFLLYLVEEYGIDPMATYLVNEREIYFVPVVNPDGYVYNQQQSPGGGGLWRKNRRNNGGGSFGVDLNRNYPYEWGFDSVGSSGDPNSQTYRGASAASEPEIQAMIAFIQAREFKTALSIHTYSNLWISPWGYDEIYPANFAEFEEIGLLATQFNGYVHGPAWTTLYTANGNTNDYDFGAHGTLSWTPEIGNSTDGFWPIQSRIVPLAEENLVAMQRTALAAGAWIRVEAADLVPLGDGDSFPEPGESVRIAVGLRNSGLAPSGPIDASLSSTSPFVTITVGNTSTPGLNNFSSVNLSPQLEFELAAGTPLGTQVEVIVSTTEGGLTTDTVLGFDVGEPVIVASFDFEAAGDQGWAVGNPNNANTGNWVRGNPNPTAAQPGDDHTPTGDTCWFTGQGSQNGALGENDVDGGTTTLVSPIFNVDGLDQPKLSYWRWYSNNTGSSVDDVFQVDLSSDGGSSWVSAETLGPNGPDSVGGWIQQELTITDFVPATAQLRVRFLASDLGSGSIVEAALDDVLVSAFPGDCPPPSVYCIGLPNSSGPGAQISTSGSQLIGDNAFNLAVQGSTPGEFGIFYYGDAQANVSVGNGIRCVGGSTYRLGATQANGLGMASNALDITNPPIASGQILAGATWNFQWWYRDPMVGAGFNFSDAVSVSFCD
ncbi:MAG: carboxypeptidase T [Planctomycetota bacterium]|jgi:carboxypeptidase T